MMSAARRARVIPASIAMRATNRVVNREVNENDFMGWVSWVGRAAATGGRAAAVAAAAQASNHCVYVGWSRFVESCAAQYRIASTRCPSLQLLCGIPKRRYHISPG